MCSPACGYDYRRVQEIRGVYQPLQLLHQLIRFPAPFRLHKRRHVAASAMFRLERSIVSAHDKFHDIVHKTCILINRALVVESLAEDKEQVSILRVAE